MTLSEYRKLVIEMFPKHKEEIEESKSIRLVQQVAMGIFINNYDMNSELAIQTRKVHLQLHKKGYYDWDGKEVTAAFNPNTSYEDIYDIVHNRKVK